MNILEKSSIQQFNVRRGFETVSKHMIRKEEALE